MIRHCWNNQTKFKEFPEDEEFQRMPVRVLRKKSVGLFTDVKMEFGMQRSQWLLV